MFRLLPLIVVFLLSGCGTFLPLTTVFEFSEAAQAVEEDKQQPTEIKTTITKDTKGEIVVKTDSQKSIVGSPIINPEMKPTFDVDKSVNSIPNWLYFIVILSGALFFINMLRSYYKNKKGVAHDSNGTNNNGWRSSDGRSVQIHGQRTEEQTKTARNDDADESAEIRSSERRPRVSIKVGRRSGE